MSAQALRTARCACGTVAFEVRGAPIVSAICHCDDCQAGASQLAAVHLSRPVIDATLGTAYSLYRRDRVRCVAGEGKLKPFKLKPDSSTERVVATCCGTAMLVRFERGPFWVSIYSAALGADAPPMEMRVQTRFVSKAVRVPEDVPAYAFAPMRFVAKIALARAAMLLGR